MMTATIYGEKITDRAALHAALADALTLPEYYGANLDALHDCLTSISTPTVLQIVDFPALEQNLGVYAQRFIHVVFDAAQENPNFTVECITE